MGSRIEEPATKPATNGVVGRKGLGTGLLILAATTGGALVLTLVPDLLAPLRDTVWPGILQSALTALTFGVALAIVLAVWHAPGGGQHPGALALIGTFAGVMATCMAMLAMPSAFRPTTALLHITGLISAAGIAAAALSAGRPPHPANAFSRWAAMASGCGVSLLLIVLTVAAIEPGAAPQSWVLIAATGLALSAHLGAAATLAARLRRHYRPDTVPLLFACSAGAIADFFLAAAAGGDDTRQVIASIFRIAAFALVFWTVLRQATIAARARVHEAQIQAAGILDLSWDWFWEQDADLRFTSVTKLYPGWGINPIGKTRWELPWLEVPPELRAAHDAVLAARESFGDLELPAPDGKGGVNWVSISGKPVYDSRGIFRGYRGITTDITRRKFAELQQRETEQLSRSMLEGLSASICIVDGNCSIVAINGAWEEYCSENGEEPGHVCEGSDYLKSVGCVPGPHLEALTSGLRQVLAGERRQFEIEYPRHSMRNRRWYLAKASRISGEGPPRVVISHDEITPIRRARQILSIEKKVLEMLASGEPLAQVFGVLSREFEQLSWEGRYAFWALDPQGGHLRLCAAPSLPPTYLEAVEGVAPGEGSGSCAAAAFRREPVFCADIEHDRLWDALRETALLHGLRASWSFPVLRDGDVLGVVAVYFDAPRQPDQSEYELLERAAHIAAIAFNHARAEERRRLMSEVFFSSQEGIIISDAQNRILMVNRAFTEITGYTAVEALGRNPRMLSSGLQDQAFYTAMWSAIHSRGRWQGELWDKRSNGERYCEHLSITSVRNQRGEVMHYVTIFSDITEKKAAEENILRMNAELEHRVEERTRRLAAANRELEAFSYSVSHDLRAPLRSIEGFSRVLSVSYAAQLDQAGRDYLQRIERASQRMNQLIEDMLKLSHISMSEVKRSRVDLTTLARNILVELASATSPPRNIELHIEDNLTIDADPGLARIALENLLANACKFTSRTALARIEVRALPPGEGAGFLVRDNGAGFDMTYADKLFGTFQRLHSTTEFEGTGVGLAIVRRIANLHGWNVQARGEPGKGAEFRISTLES